jgi:hypothetical protein
MQRTNAYEEISTGINPCLDHLQVTLSSIDPLLKKKAIDLELWKNKMRPDPKTVELAHLYFIPKPHKVRWLYIKQNQHSMKRKYSNFVF